MISYLINFTLCSGLLLLAYYLLLKNKALFQFNRVYLVLSLLFSLSIPLIVIHRDIAPVPSFAPAKVIAIDNARPVTGGKATAAPIIHEKINYYNYAVAGIYGLVTLLLMLRFLKNIFTITRSTWGREKLYHNGAWLVLTDRPLVPHTFLSFIFLNQQDYYDGAIEKDIIHHEMAHARQYHSIDIIFVELVQAFCWFNPFIFLYKRAIQVNHEFIADAAALRHSGDACSYKTLLLSKASQLNSLSITSQFNYSITKKRLIMMTKHTSAAAAWFTRLAILPVMAAAFMLFCGKTEAQQTIATKSDSAVKPAKPAETKKARSAVPRYLSSRPYPSTPEGISVTEMTEYASYEKKYATRRLSFDRTMTKDEEKHLEQLYQRMSPEQQKDRAISFTYPPDPMGKNYVTRAQLDMFKDPVQYGVWIDDRRVSNAVLKDIDPKRFCVLLFSRLTPVAVKNDHFHYQITLMTRPYYKKYVENAIANRNNSMIMFHLKS